MSQSSSTPSKTVTTTDYSESATDYHLQDRWSHSVSYRQLIVSSCIGIVQLWWHPYLNDLTSLLPFLFLYNVFSIIVAYPMFYLELAIGVVTKKSVGDCWDMSPIARGVSISMLCTTVFTVLALGTVSAWCLAMLVHSFHSFLPWLHCAAAAMPACTARHKLLAQESEIPPQSFFFNFVLQAKRDGLISGLGTIVWELCVYHIIAWTLIYLIAIKRIYSYSKMVLFKDVLAMFTLICCMTGAWRLDGAQAMFSEPNFSVLFSFQIWREAIEFSLIQMSISQGTVIMLGSYCPNEKHKIPLTTFAAFMASKIFCMAGAFTLGAVHGALQVDYGSKINLLPGTPVAIILWSDLVARTPGSQFWSALVFFTLFVLAVSSAALLMQTLMSVFTGPTLRKIRWALLIISCALFCFLSIITLCTQGGVYIVNFLMTWPVSKTRLPIAAVVSAVTTYVYGQTAFCEDIYFATGDYPSVFLRICWALLPFLLFVFFISGMAVWPPGFFGWILVTVTLVPIVAIMLCYVFFKFRVRNIVANGK